MHFLLFTKIGEDSIRTRLGVPEYSYYFVYKGFRPVFEALGSVTPVHTASDIHRCYERIEARGESCVVVFFCPPHVAPDIHPLKAFCVLAWEFDTIPDECWDEDPRNDWRYVFQRHLGVICLSSNTRTVVEKAMGNGFPVWDIPVPVRGRYESAVLPDAFGKIGRRHTLEISGIVIDSWAYRITPDVLELKEGCDNFCLATWDGAAIELVFNQDHMDSGLLGGFYHAEDWGTWSRLADPWLFLECYLDGNFILELKARGFGASVGKTITLSIGGVARQFVLHEAPALYRLEFDAVPSSNILRFFGLDLTPRSDVRDLRSMGIGLERLKITDAGEKPRIPSTACKKSIRLDLGGVIYVSVFNPAGSRKNWAEIVSAFCYAFQENEKATLILKVAHHTVKSIMGKLHFLLQQIGPVKCRVVALHGFLPDEKYQQLIDAASFYVNASSGEGLCLPLLEFMACGVPAIAPDHTAMADYVDEYASFPLKYSRSLDTWPHDPREKKRAISYKADWGSLAEQYRQSYQCVLHDPETYRFKSAHSRRNALAFANEARVTARLKDFIKDTAKSEQ